MKKQNIFNAQTVTLQGKNAIEASAGTGKTYSIAVLVLRLLLENRVDENGDTLEPLAIEEILMVTFTKVAVAELSERVRIFVKSALIYIKTEELEEETIKNIVNSAKNKIGKDKVLFLLKKAVAFLDEIAVFTIHGFCQRTLGEFAFETGQIFEANLITDESKIINREVNKFWRTNIVNRPKEEIKFLVAAGLSKDSLMDIIKQAMNGKEYFVDIEVSFDKLLKSEQAYKDVLANEQYVLKENINDIISRITVSKRKDIENYLENFDTIEQSPFFTQKKTLTAYYVKKLGDSHPIINFYENLLTTEAEYEQNKNRYLFSIYKKAIKFCKKEVEEYKSRNSVITQNDLINHLYNAVKSESKDEISLKLSEKYKALFIDEFQDTDEKQYKIFSELFPKSLIFFIGDPKQSIYGFRGADLDSYQQAIDNISEDNIFTMDKNFRANKPLVEAMNQFFSIDDPFLNDKISYIDVEAGQTMDVLQKDGVNDTPFTILKVEKVSEISAIVAKQINEILCGDYKIGAEKINLKKHSIGVLVSSHSKGKEIKEKLSELGIPAVMKNDNKVLESSSVGEFLSFLEAIVNTEPQSIKKILLTSFLDYNIEDISKITDEELIEFSEFFRKEASEYRKNGVFILCQNIIKFFGLKNLLLSRNNLRDLSNIQQLIELLHKKEKSGFETLEELISWVKRVRFGLEESGDEYEERVESDEEAIEIVTIHSSKGLDYDIVFAPYLDSYSNNKSKTIDYKKGGIKYFSSLKTEEAKELEKQERKVENKRLIYVAITRAKYKVYLTEKEKEPDVGEFLDNLKIFPNLYNQNRIDELEEFEYKKYNFWRESYHIDLSRRLKKISFTKSFSSLNGIKHSYHKQDEIKHTGYDKFIFSKLPKGAAIGTFLHEIYENVDFTDDKNWVKIIKKRGSKNISAYDEKLMSRYVEMIKNTVEANLGTGFTLSQIPMDKRLVEMEFYFKTEGKTAEIENYLVENGFPKMKVNSVEIDGAIMGFIDLLFEHKGKYYILDWKSNHLGYSLENYNEAGVTKGMNEANYNLQYLIYGVATKRFLESRGENFKEVFGGVLYLFLRGLRSGKDTGVFYRSGKECLGVLEGLDRILSNKEDAFIS